MKKRSYIFCLLIILFLVTSCSKNKLKTPDNVNVIFNELTSEVIVYFDEVKNATNYLAYFYEEDNLYQTFEVKNGSKILGIPDGSYIIRIQAIDETDNYKASRLSDKSKTIDIVTNTIKLSKPTNVTGIYNSLNSKITIDFDLVNNASSYYLIVYQENEIVYENTITKGSLIDLPTGEYTIRIKAIGDNVKYFDSDLSDFSTLIKVLDKTSVNEELTSIAIKGLENKTVSYGSEYNIMSGIRVVGNDNATYLTKINTTSSIELINNCIPADYIGEVIFTYHTSYNNLEASGQRKIIVLDESGETTGDNLISNGDFSYDTSGWNVSNHEGASSNISVINQAIKVNIQALNQSNASSPRINSNNFTLEKGTKYVVSFDAWAIAPKAIQVQVGELFDHSPYFTNYMSKDPEVFILDQQKKNYSFTFTYSDDLTNNATILFEMGIVSGIVTITDVFYDNIKICSTSEQTLDRIVPKIEGVKDQTLYVNSRVEFDPLEDVHAYDNSDGDLTDRINYTIKTNNQVVSKIDLSIANKYEIFYTVMDNSYNMIQKIALIDVVLMPKEEGNLLINGDFTEGLKNWHLATHEGGFANGEVENGLMKVEMTGINWNDYSSSPRLNNFIPFDLIVGESYKVSFDAYADDTKNILVQIGELYEMSPYWLDLKQETRQVYTLSNEMTHYEFLFVNNMFNSQNGFITFEMGVVDDDKTITNIYFDNIKIEHLDYALDDYIAPQIKGLSNHWFFSGEITSFNPLENVSVIDNVDGDLTNQLTYKIYLNNKEVDTIDLIKENEYLIEYKVADKSSNQTVKKIKLTILQEKAKINNLLENPTWYKNEDGISDFVVQPITNGVQFILSETGGTATWDERAVTNNFYISTNTEYTIFFDAISTKERDVFLQIGNYANTSNFQVQYSKVIRITDKLTRYCITFTSNTNGNFALGFEMGKSSNYPYIQSNITVTNVVLMKGKVYLPTPTGIVLNKIAAGTILAFAANYPGGTKFLLYVYDQNNALVNNTPFSIINGQNLNDLKLPKGTYTIKIQAVGTTSDVVASNISSGYTYIN